MITVRLKCATRGIISGHAYHGRMMAGSTYNSHKVLLNVITCFVNVNVCRMCTVSEIMLCKPSTKVI